MAATIDWHDERITKAILQIISAIEQQDVLVKCLKITAVLPAQKTVLPIGRFFGMCDITEEIA